MRIVPDTKVNLINRCSGMDGGWGMKEEFFEESMKVAERCVNDLNQKEVDSVCSDCSLASHQIKQASNGKTNRRRNTIETRTDASRSSRWQRSVGTASERAFFGYSIPTEPNLNRTTPLSSFIQHSVRTLVILE